MSRSPSHETVVPPPPGDREPRGQAAETRARVQLGEFGRAHGIAGEVRLKSFCADPVAIGRYSPIETTHGKPLRLLNVRPASGSSPDMLIARVEGITSREGAESLNRVGLFVAREQLKDETEEDEFLLADLIGLAVAAPDGTALGRIRNVLNFGAGDLLEVTPAQGGAVVLVPFTKVFVPEIDIKAGRVVVEPANLFDPPEPEPKG